MTKVSCVIVNYNTKYFPRMCLEHLEKSKCGFDFEIIFVDNASHDESLEFLEKAYKDGKIKLIKSNKNLGFGGGNNLGAKNAEGKYILIMNPDIFVEPDTLQKMVDYMEKHQDTGVLGPKLIYYNGTVQDSCRRHMNYLTLIAKRTFLKKIPPFKGMYEKYVMNDADYTQTREVDLLVGACFMIPRKVYEQVGGFDERYFLFMEDFDLCREIHKKGHKIVYFPETQVLHYHKRLSQGSVLRLLTKKVFWIHNHSALKYFWKWRKG
ncbi:MAG: glycosyltransferase family 2 protein [Patescibacteria group bacterium]|nr:glycosyltransferase family 2 protein [Patescibacteria group bacterium]